MGHLENLNSETPRGAYKLKTTAGSYKVQLGTEVSTLTRLAEDQHEVRFLSVDAHIGRRAVFMLPSDKGLENTLTTAPIITITLIDD